MRSLLRIAVTVIIAASAAAVAPAAHASGSSGISIAIDSVSPQYVRPDSTVTVTGTVTNGTGATLTGLSVQLSSSTAWFSSRGLMDAFAAGTYNPSLLAEGDQDLLGAIRPGATVSWRAKFSVAVVGLSHFGVYPLQAAVFNPGTGSVTAAKTLLPFWPTSTRGISQLKIAWVWPLIDQPHRQACAALTNDSLDQSMGAGGRLHSLLNAAAAHPQVNVTWAIDPALLRDASTMSSSYQVVGPGWRPDNCTGATLKRASAAAKSWLASLKTATSGQPVLITPYGNTDVAALAHRGLNADLRNVYQLGQATAGQVLNRPFMTNMALPAGGLADQSVLTTLATSEHVTSVVLSSGEMPPTDPAVFADDSVTSIRTMAGTRMDVLLADDTLTNLLKSASGPLSADAQFAVEQRFLAETAMIASEAPNSSRSVVVSPPETWDPSLALAQRLLAETSAAPWLQPVQLSSLAGSRDSESHITRKSPPDTKYSPRELTKGYLTMVSTLGARLGLYKSLLDQPTAGYTNGLDQALAATESSAWRGAGTSAAGGRALVDNLFTYLDHAQGGVKIVPSTEITMAGSSGVLPITIQNRLQHNVQVRVSATVPVSEGGAPALHVDQPDGLIKINAQQAVVYKLHVSSAPSGTTAIQLQLTSKDGRQIPQSEMSLSVHSTRYGQAILILIGAAIGLFVLTSLFRAGRRWLSAPGNVRDGRHPPVKEGGDG